MDKGRDQVDRQRSQADRQRAGKAVAELQGKKRYRVEVRHSTRTKTASASEP